MTKEELKTLIGQRELNKAVIDIIAYVVNNRKAVDSAIAAAYPGARIMQIEKKYAGYEVDLNNGLELKFNQSLQMRVDD